MQVRVKKNKILTEKLLKEGYSIGFHGACNALSNFLYLANLNINRQYSIFDGDITKRGEYLPFSSIPIKHSSDPTYSEMDYIFIAASTASEAIRQSAKGKIKEENIISTKRKSYRQKVKDFKTNKLKRKDSDKIPKNNKNLDVIKKQDDQEKRQGWWNQ